MFDPNTGIHSCMVCREWAVSYELINHDDRTHAAFQELLDEMEADEREAKREAE